MKMIRIKNVERDVRTEYITKSMVMNDEKILDAVHDAMERLVVFPLFIDHKTGLVVDILMSDMYEYKYPVMTIKKMDDDHYERAQNLGMSLLERGDEELARKIRLRSKWTPFVEAFSVKPRDERAIIHWMMEIAKPIRHFFDSLTFSVTMPVYLVASGAVGMIIIHDGTEIKGSVVFIHNPVFYPIKMTTFSPLYSMRTIISNSVNEQVRLPMFMTHADSVHLHKHDEVNCWMVECLSRRYFGESYVIRSRTPMELMSMSSRERQGDVKRYDSKKNHCPFHYEINEILWKLKGFPLFLYDYMSLKEYVRLVYYIATGIDGANDMSFGYASRIAEGYVLPNLSRDRSGLTLLAHYLEDQGMWRHVMIATHKIQYLLAVTSFAHAKALVETDTGRLHVWSRGLPEQPPIKMVEAFRDYYLIPSLVYPQTNLRFSRMKINKFFKPGLVNYRAWVTGNKRRVKTVKYYKNVDGEVDSNLESRYVQYPLRLMVEHDGTHFIDRDCMMITDDDFFFIPIAEVGANRLRKTLRVMREDYHKIEITIPDSYEIKDFIDGILRSTFIPLHRFDDERGLKVEDVVLYHYMSNYESCPLRSIYLFNLTDIPNQFKFPNAFKRLQLAVALISDDMDMLDQALRDVMFEVDYTEEWSRKKLLPEEVTSEVVRE